MTIEYQKRVRGSVVDRFDISPSDADEIDRLLNAKRQIKAHGNSKAVVVWGAVDDDIYNDRIDQHRARPITEMTFPSSKAASLHFGYSTDTVGYALRQAERRGESIAVVGGVPIRWVASIRD